MLDTVDDGIVVITEDQVTVFAHQLHDQCLVTQIAHLIQMFNVNMHNTFQPRLRDVHNTPFCKCLRRSIQKLGAVMGLGLLVSVR